MCIWCKVARQSNISCILSFARKNIGPFIQPTFIQPTLLDKKVTASVVQRLNICLGLHSTLIFIKYYMYILANLLLNHNWHQVWPEDSGALDSKHWNYISLYLASWLKEAKMGAVMYSRSKTQVYFFSGGTIRHVGLSGMWGYQACGAIRHVGLSGTWKKIVLNHCFSWTVNSEKYTVL